VGVQKQTEDRKRQRRLFQRREAAIANIRLPTDDNLVGGTSSALEAEDRSRRLDGMSARRRRSHDRLLGAAPCRQRYVRVASLKSICSDARSQCRPASVVVMCSERRRLAIDLATAFVTDWRCQMRRAGSPDSTAFP
jgi:hypothetical protein